MVHKRLAVPINYTIGKGAGIHNVPYFKGPSLVIPLWEWLAKLLKFFRIPVLMIFLCAIGLGQIINGGSGGGSGITSITGTDGVNTNVSSGPFTISFSGCTVGGTSSTWTITCAGGASHNLLSSTHSDTTAASAVRGDGIFAIGATPTWQRLAHPTVTGGYFKWNGTDVVASTLAAAGTGTCTNQFVRAANADAAPTCNTVAQGDVTNGYVDLSSAQNPIAGTKTFTGAINHTNTLTQTGNITVGNENGVVWIDGTKYATYAAGLADTQCASFSCELTLPSSFTQNLTTTQTIGGSATQFVNVKAMPGAATVCNVTTGIPCFSIKANGGLTGEAPGASSGGGTGGYIFTYPSTANMSCYFCFGDTTTAGGNSYVRAEQLFVYGNATATVGTAVMDFSGINNLPIIQNDYIANFANTIGFHVHSSPATNGVAGPFLISNVWAAGFNNAGARPCVYESSGNSILGIDIESGVCNGAGSGQAILDFEGNSTGSASLRGISDNAGYVENLVNGSSIGIKLKDVNAAAFSGVVGAFTDTDTMYDISESGAGRTCGIQIHASFKGSPTNAATLVNNHITGKTLSGANLPFYNYGGESGCSAAPFTVDSNTAVFGTIINSPTAELTVTSSAATLNGLEIDDTEASGKNIYFGPGVTAVGRASLVDKSDSNTELFTCFLSTTGPCAAKALVLGALNSGTLANGNLSFTEVASGTAAAATDDCYGDSTAHAVKCSYNNSAFSNVPLTGLTNVFSVSQTFTAGIQTGASPPACTAGTAGFMCNGEGTAPTNVASTAAIYPSSTTHEYMAATNGASTASPGMMVRVQPSPINNTAKTAAVTTATLCAASAGACNTAGQYRISYNFWGSGTACSAVTAGSVGLNFTWTDENAVAHTTISVPMWDQKSAANGILFNFNTALGTEGASGSYVISTNGSVIQYATTYTACTTGTGTYNLRIAAERLQ